MKNLFNPKEVRKVGNRELRIIWEDGHESSYSFSHLRKHCQCALCVDEWSGRPLLDREKVSEELEGGAVNLVGGYAVRINFSDGHNTGIYAFKHLRQICPCSPCEIRRRRGD